jgi:hypothetical protein
MMTTSEAVQWCLRHTSYSASLRHLVQSLLLMPINMRKHLLTIVRCQVHFSTESRVFKRIGTKDINRQILIYCADPKVTPTYTSIADLWKHLLDKYHDPIGASIISTLIRCVPFLDLDSAKKERLESRDKEVRAALGRYHPYDMHFDSFLTKDQSIQQQRVNHNLPLDPALHGFIATRLYSTAKSLSKRPYILPRLSKKTPGKVTQENIRTYTQENDLYTYTDMERMYMRDGVRFSGPAEMRSAWTYNLLKPRVYYAQGATNFHASKYIQQIFNALVDSFSMTHTFSRFAHTSLPFTPDKTMFICSS